MNETNENVIKMAAKGVGNYVVGLVTDTAKYIGDHPFVSMLVAAPSVMFYSILIAASCSKDKDE